MLAHNPRTTPRAGARAILLPALVVIVVAIGSAACGSEAPVPTPAPSSGTPGASRTPETATGAPPAASVTPQGCPAEAPAHLSSCAPEGLQCSYACVQGSPAEAHCFDGAWQMSFYDVPCKPEDLE